LTPHLLGSLASLGSAAVWAGISVLVRQVPSSVSPLALNIIRSAVGGLLLLPPVWLTGGVGDLAGAPLEIHLILVFSVVTAFGFGDSLFFESARRIGVARSLPVAMSYPLLTTAFAGLFLGERITPWLVVGTILTVLGVCLIGLAAPEQARAPAAARGGLTLALLAAVSWAASAASLKPAADHLDPMAASAFRMLAAALLLGPTPWGRGTWRSALASGTAGRRRLLAIGVLSAATSVLFVAGIRWAGAAVAAVMTSTAPLFGIPLACIFLGERVTSRIALGAALTVLGIILVGL
jgi:drug/metabolite transporter (DMT)-like permease